MMKPKTLFSMTIISLIALTASPKLSLASTQSWSRVEIGLAESKWNFFRIPTTGGTHVSLPSGGSQLYGRFESLYHLSDKSFLRLVLLPFKTQYSFTPDTSINFNNQSYAANTATTATYQFNSYRIGYVYKWLDGDTLNSWVGATAKIRDAFIEVTQGSTTSRRSDLGFVPLAYFAANLKLADAASLVFDIDGLAGGPGYALDGRLELQVPVSSVFSASGGGRILTGGADAQAVTTFATVAFYYLGLQYNY